MTGGQRVKKQSLPSGESLFPYRLVLLGLLGWIAIGFPRMLVSPLLPLIEAEFNVPHAQSALLMSGYLFPYALVQLPAGSLSDRFGNKYIMLLAMFGTSFGSLLISFTSSFNQALALRLFSGSLSGFWFPSNTNIIIQRTEDARQGRALGITYSGGAIASIFIYLTVSAVSNSGMGWRPFFLIASFPGFLCLVLTYIFTRDLKETREKKDGEKKADRAVITEELRSRSIILVLAFNFLASLAGWSLGVFIPTYFVQDRGLLVAEASSIMLVQASFAIFNGFLAGYMTDSFGFKIPVVVSMVTMCLVSLLLPLTPLGIAMGVLLFFWGLMGGWSFTALNVFITKAVPSRLRGTFLGLYNQMGFISATVGPPIFGLVIDIAGFNSFFRLALAFYVASLISILLVKERR
jgi:MFS family permease